MPLYFNIPFPDHPVLKEVQDYLRGRLAEGAVFVEPGTFHLTLVFMPDAMPGSIVAPSLPLPLFGIGGAGAMLDAFKIPDGWAIHVPVTLSPQLIALQTMLFYEARRAGLVVDMNSWPGNWKPHITMAYVSEWNWDVWDTPVAIHLTVDRFILTGDNFQLLETYNLMQTDPSGGAITEMIKHLSTITEFAGSFPEVPLFSDVDRKNLIQGDNDPMFVTLKVAETGSTSGNGRYYDRDFVSNLQNQIKALRPIANRGHIPPDQRDTSYPTPAAFWVGATLMGETLWAKAYIPPSSPMREEIRIRKAAGGKVSTSIYGTGKQEYDKVRGAWRVYEFELESIDFAPPERAGVPSLATAPYITSEMNETSSNGGKKPMDKLQVISELTADDARLLPDVVRTAILAASDDTKLIKELRGMLGDGDLLAAIKEMKAAADKAVQVAVEAAITTEIAAAVLPGVSETPAEDDPVKAARGLVREIVVARTPKTVEAVKEFVAEAAKLGAVQQLIKSTVQTEMGPPQGKQMQPKDKDGKQPERKLTQIPKEEAANK